jgi:3-oxoacyl-[acyl-carrier protein] reductase
VSAAVDATVNSEGASVVIIGASASIGSSIVDRFRAAGSRLVVTYCRNDRFRAGEDVRALPLDLASDASIERFVADLRTLVERVDIAIVLSGLLFGKSLREYALAEIDTTMAVNFTGQVKVVMQMLPMFSPGSQVLLLSSISAQKGSYDPVYAAAKGAVLSFVKSLAGTLAPDVRINAIAPGLIKDSSMYCAMTPERREWHRLQTPRKRLLERADLAEIIFDLSRDHWAHLNGACIDLNGGQYVR